ncbi:hypothetical protein [Flavobacterium sp.]|jgi:hypothetical protein|uniref:hypothetical protein n=1 Tax=Flavobacterium sp. TaxID=239 RepID=UPI0037BF0BC7
MKSIRTLRLLSLLGFLLLMAPFYDQCNGHGMKKAEAPTKELMVDTTAIESLTVKNNNSIERNPIAKDSIVDLKTIETPLYVKAYEFIDVESNQNAFELANMSSIYFEGSFAEFKEELSKDFKKHKYDGLSLFIRSFSFVFIMFITFSILILSFTKRIKWVYKLSIANLSLILITLICILFFDDLFETYKQIKWGYYAFTLVQLGIFYTSKYQITSSKS